MKPKQLSLIIWLISAHSRYRPTIRETDLQQQIHTEELSLHRTASFPSGEVEISRSDA